MITEVLARSLTLDELSTRMLEHNDVAVRVFAQRVIAEADELAQESFDYLKDIGNVQR